MNFAPPACHISKQSMVCSQSAVSVENATQPGSVTESTFLPDKQLGQRQLGQKQLGQKQLRQKQLGQTTETEITGTNNWDRNNCY